MGINSSTETGSNNDENSDEDGLSGSKRARQPSSSIENNAKQFGWQFTGEDDGTKRVNGKNVQQKRSNNKTATAGGGGGGGGREEIPQGDNKAPKKGERLILVNAITKDGFLVPSYSSFLLTRSP